MEDDTNIIKRTMSIYNKNNNYNKILDYLTSISKNIYNCTIYCYKIYKIFKDNIFKDLYTFIINSKYDKIKFTDESKKINSVKNKSKNKSKNESKNEEKSKSKKKIKSPIIVKIEEELYKIYNNYYLFYSNNKSILDDNNNILYKYIINDINANNIFIDSSNITKLEEKYNNECININNINFNVTNKLLVFNLPIKSIIRSIYFNNYYKCKKIINQKGINKKDVDNKYIIDEINNNTTYYNNETNNYYEIIKNKLKIPLGTIENLISRVTYQNLGNNYNYMPSDLIINIISKAYSNIKSYYLLLQSGTQVKTSMCKFLGKNDKFNLFYYLRSFKIENNKIRFNVGDHINNIYDELVKTDYKKVLINDKTYYYYKYDLINNIDHIKLKSEQSKYININNMYIYKNDLKKFNYIYIDLPKKIQEYKIKLIDIKPCSGKYKFCVVYDKPINNLCQYDVNKFNNLSLKEKLEKSISIDTGLTNLMTIYNPTGEQYIIKGGELKSINDFYNYKISNLNSINKKKHNKENYKRLSSLHNERVNKINGILDRIVNTLIKNYPNKEVFIVGYNENWKTKVNLGKTTNRRFYQIPYARLIDKLRSALLLRNKYLMITKESYTSICDSLSLEEINYHETYKGKRIKRGLFSSFQKKLINSDLNGAINIMRKKINLQIITGLNLYNPQLLNYNKQLNMK